MSTPRQCGELTSDGSPCKSVGPLYNDGHCGWHSSDPEAQEWRDKMRETLAQQGFKTRKPKESIDPAELPPPPKTLEDLKQWSAWVVWAVAAGELDKATASKVVAAISEMRRVIGASEHEKRIAEIERKIKAAQERRA